MRKVLSQNSYLFDEKQPFADASHAMKSFQYSLQLEVNDDSSAGIHSQKVSTSLQVRTQFPRQIFLISEAYHSLSEWSKGCWDATVAAISIVQRVSAGICVAINEWLSGFCS